MNNNKKISIIIPFYNSEKYIAECYYSVYNAAYTYLDNIEIIFIDDCGNDKSKEILEKIKHEDIIIIENKKNLKQGGARNIGVKNSSGKWIMFVDADDKISENSIKELLKKINDVSEECKIIKFGYTEVYSDKEIEHEYANENTDVFFPIAPWAKIIRREIFREYKENLIYEDLFQNIEYIKFEKDLSLNYEILNKSLYLYNQENTGSVTSIINEKDIIYIHNKLCEFYYDEKDTLTKKQLYNMHFHFIYYIKVGNLNIKKTLIKNWIKMGGFSISKNIAGFLAYKKTMNSMISHEREKNEEK